MLFDLLCLYSCFSSNSQPLPVGVWVSQLFLPDGSDIFFPFFISYLCIYFNNTTNSTIMRLDYYKVSKFQVEFFSTSTIFKVQFQSKHPFLVAITKANI
jgi:hypothetical protein